MLSFVKNELMKKYVLSILSLIIFTACNPSKHLSNTDDLPIQVKINDPVKIGETILFEIKNNFSEPVTVFYPQRLWIEKQEGVEWQKLKILECLCDAPCQASEDKMLLEPDKLFELKWDQKESWCGPRKSGQIRETIFKQATKGKYKIIIQYRTKTGEDLSISKEFKITS